VAPRKKVGERAAPLSEAEELRRLSKLAALLLVKGEEQAEKMRVLNAVGFSAEEIATMLSTTLDAVYAATYRLRKRKK
jgi:hypothetical protein